MSASFGTVPVSDHADPWPFSKKAIRRCSRCSAQFGEVSLISLDSLARITEGEFRHHADEIAAFHVAHRAGLVLPDKRSPREPPDAHVRDARRCSPQRITGRCRVRRGRGRRSEGAVPGTGPAAE